MAVMARQMWVPSIDEVNTEALPWWHWRLAKGTSMSWGHGFRNSWPESMVCAGDIAVKGADGSGANMVAWHEEAPIASWAWLVVQHR